jgi:hypothetical protein
MKCEVEVLLQDDLLGLLSRQIHRSHGFLGSHHQGTCWQAGALVMGFHEAIFIGVPGQAGTIVRKSPFRAYGKTHRYVPLL